MPRGGSLLLLAPSTAAGWSSGDSGDEDVHDDEGGRVQRVPGRPVGVRVLLFFAGPRTESSDPRPRGIRQRRGRRKGDTVGVGDEDRELPKGTGLLSEVFEMYISNML